MEPHPTARRVPCLKCRGPIETERSRVDVCPRCGFANSGALRRIYWTREPALVRLEAQAKAVVLLVTFGTCCGVFLPVRIMFPGGGWIVALPLSLGIGLWLTASKITGWVPYFSPGIFWSAVFALAAIPALAFHWGFSIASLALAGYVQILARRAARWRARRARWEDPPPADRIPSWTEEPKTGS